MPKPPRESLALRPRPAPRRHPQPLQTRPGAATVPLQPARPRPAPTAFLGDGITRRPHRRAIAEDGWVVAADLPIGALRQRPTGVLAWPLSSAPAPAGRGCDSDWPVILPQNAISADARKAAAGFDVQFLGKVGRGDLGTGRMYLPRSIGLADLDHGAMPPSVTS